MPNKWKSMFVSLSCVDTFCRAKLQREVEARKDMEREKREVERQKEELEEKLKKIQEEEQKFRQGKKFVLKCRSNSLQ